MVYLHFVFYKYLYIFYTIFYIVVTNNNIEKLIEYEWFKKESLGACLEKLKLLLRLKSFILKG